jgi:hypothetical protein
MRGANSLGGTLIVRAPGTTRFLGGWICVIATFGFVGAVTAGGAGHVILLLWGVLGLWWGMRVMRVGVYETSDGLVVRNRYTTSHVHWDDIALIEFKKRPLGAMRLSMVSGRRCGALTLRSGVVLWLDATETMRDFVSGHLWSQPDDEARAKTEKVKEAWRRRVGSA